MPLGNTSYLQIPLMAESDNQKYLLFNNAIQAVDDSLNRLLGLDFSVSDITLTESQLTRYGYFRGTGHTVPRVLTIPATVGSSPAIATNRFFIFENGGTDSVTLTHGGAGATVVVPASTVTLVYCDGTDITSVAAAAGFNMGVRDEGSTDFVTNPTFLNFVGNGVTAALNGLGADITVSLTEVQDEGVSTQTDTAFINFTGAGVTAVANGTGVDVTIPGATSGVDVQDEGVAAVSAASVLNFIGNNVTAADNGGVADVTIQGAAVQDEGTPVAADPTFINFVGAGVTATVNGNGVDVTISGGGGAGVDLSDSGVSVVSGATVLDFYGTNVTVTDVGGEGHITLTAPDVQDEGTSVQSDSAFINFVGAGVTATANGAGVDVTIPGASGTAMPVDKDGTNVVTSADRLNFIGSGVSVAANGTTADITINGGGGGAVETQDDGVQVVASTDTLNFTGTGVVVTNPSGNITKIDIPGGAGGKAYSPYKSRPSSPPLASYFSINLHGDNPTLTDATGKMTALGGATSGVIYKNVSNFSEVMFHHRSLGTGVFDDDGLVLIGSSGYMSIGVGTNSAAGNHVIRVLRWNLSGGYITNYGVNNLDINAEALYFRAVLNDAGTHVVVSYSEDAQVWTVHGHYDLSTIGGSVTGIGVRSKAATSTEYEFYSDPDSPYEVFLGAGLVQASEETANYVLTDADLGGNVLKKINVATANTVTVNAGLTGNEPVEFVQKGAGQTTFVAGAGVTINSADGFLKIAKQYASATLIPDGPDTYILTGYLAA